MQKKYKSIIGSEPVIKESQLIEKADNTEEIFVGLRLRANKQAKRVIGHHNNLGSELPQNKKYLSIDELGEFFGASQEDANVILGFAKEHNLDVHEVNLPIRIITLRGSTKAFNRAFNLDLELFDHPKHKFRSHRSSINIPEELEEIVRGVFGLDTQFAIEPKTRELSGNDWNTPEEVSKRYSPQKIAKIYNFPNCNAKGQKIAIISPGGGYNIGDIHYYLKNIERVNIPKITDISVLGAKNKQNPSPRDLNDFEITMDLQILGSIANEADIGVYFTPNTSQGLIYAFATALFDKERNNSVITMSWGGPEFKWNKSLIKSLNSLFKAAIDLGVTICLPAGDDGSGFDGKSFVEFPASSPYVLSCGGTKLSIKDDLIENEIVWNELGPYNQPGATGGGVSEYFTQVPDYQLSAGINFKSINPGGGNGRYVPDVASVAGRPGFNMYMNGEPTPFPGAATSAAAPLWAGLIARINEKLGHRVGYINPFIYKNAKGTKAFNDVSFGDNDIGKVGGYHAQSGWDACTGWGSPNGEELLKLFKGE